MPLRLRPDIEESVLARDRGDLRRLSMFTLIGQCFAAGVRHRIVPREHWTLDEHDEGFAVAYLLCQCGTGHCMAIGDLHRCQCPRAFFFDGTDVWALLSPLTPVS